MLAGIDGKKLVYVNNGCRGGYIDCDPRAHVVNAGTGKTACGLIGAIAAESILEINCPSCIEEIKFRANNPTDLEIGIRICKRPHRGPDGKLHLKIKK